MMMYDLQVGFQITYLDTQALYPYPKVGIIEAFNGVDVIVDGKVKQHWQIYGHDREQGFLKDWEKEIESRMENLQALLKQVRKRIK